ncbi:LysE/ArgO family amino acid transporter [Agromyces sp. Marseille-P2726]|uniref:LysE/ArgO family amino acid transporter n=1 Tax=Agromyces sp. Marseille-P2726 TaxID=2709132 RepID=UPI00156E808C|nr:LysE/ArgO family amino acid transporter [Agromyces sp. Marseille-P2726]
MPLTVVVAGLGLGFSLIIAIGAQNLFVLRQGLRREHVFAVAAICALSDLALIVVGVSGIGAVLQAVPWLVEVVRWAGAAFLVIYGLLAARRAIRPTGAALVGAAGRGDGGSGSRDASPSAALLDQQKSPSASLLDQQKSPSASLLDQQKSPSAALLDQQKSPSAALLDQRSSLGAAIATCLALTWLNPHVYLDTVFLLGSVASTHGDQRWAFALGAGAASLLWFFGLAYGARLLGGLLGSPRAWRILDGGIAVVMIALGVSLVLPH